MQLLPFIENGKWPFIAGDFTDVWDSCGIIIEPPNKEVVAEDRGVVGGECQVEIVLQLYETNRDRVNHVHRGMERLMVDYRASRVRRLKKMNW